MKKTNIIILLFLFVASGLYAQETKKQEKVYLPEAGDISIGIDARPFIDMVGNTFNGNTGNFLDKIGGDPIKNSAFNNATLFPIVSISGKYMLTDNLGVRANIGLIVNVINDAAYVQDDAAFMLDPLSEAKVIDKARYSRTGGSINLGAEYRIGKKRIQGVFSGCFQYAFATDNASYTYGNGITELNQKPSIDGSLSSGYDAQGYRSVKLFGNDPIHQFGIVGGVGVEWFFAPKISVGAEVNLSLLYAVSPQQYSMKERYNATIREIENRTDLVTPKRSMFNFGTENIGANIYFNFFF